MREQSQGEAAARLLAASSLQQAAAILDDLSLAEKRYRAAAGRAAFNVRRRRTLAAAYSLTDKAADGSIEASSGSYEEYALALTRLERELLVSFLHFHPQSALHATNTTSASTPLIFMHPSKAGGTSFIDVMKRNVPESDRPAREGAWEVGDGPQWCQSTYNDANLGHPRERSCAERFEHFQQRGWSTLAIERWLDNGGMLCDEIMYATVMREPLSRVISHVNHWFRPPSKISGLGMWGLNENLCTSCSLDKALEAAPHMFSTVFREDDCNGTAIGVRFNETSPGVRGGFGDTVCGLSSDYQARHLLGSTLAQNPFDFTAFDFASTGEEERASLELRASETLLGMSLVYTTEETPQEDVEVLIQSTLGWPAAQLPHANDANDHPERRLMSLETLAPLELGILRQKNQLDTHVHQLAVGMATLDVLTLRRWGQL